MSNLPDSTFGYHYTQTQQYGCNLCEARWEVEGTVDMNEWEADHMRDEDCPKCNSHNTGSVL